MTTFLQLRAGNSGPVFHGEIQNDTLLWDVTEKKFFVGPLSAAGLTSDDIANESSVPGDTVTDALNAISAGAGVPLTREFWVDAGRVGSSEDGSIGNPFLTIQAAIDELAALNVDGTVVIAPGDYTAEELTIGRAVALLGDGQSPGPLSITITAGFVLLERIGTGTLTLALGASLHWVYGSAGTLNINGGAVYAEFCTWNNVVGNSNLNTFTLTNCQMNSLSGADNGTIVAYNCAFSGSLVASVIRLWSSTVGGAITVGTLELNQSSVDGVVTVDAFGDTEADSYSLNSLRIGAPRAHTLTNLTITDHPYFQGVFVVPALVAGAFADVTIGGSGLFLEPGDTIDMAMGTSGPAPRLADVAPVAAWVEANGDLTVRFFGTTAGGTQILDFNVNRNSG